LGFKIWGLRVGIQGSVQGLKCKVTGIEFMGQGLEFTA